MRGSRKFLGAVSVPRSAARALAPAGLLALIAALIATGALSGSGATSRAEAQPPVEAPTPQTDASVPASAVTMIGATPEEPGAPGGEETWGVGSDGTSMLVRYYEHPVAGGGEEGTWTLGPALPKEFTLAGSPLAGQMTPTGFGVLVGTGSGGSKDQVLLVRKPGGGFVETTHVPIEGEEPEPAAPLLVKGQRLFGSNRAPMIAPLQEAGGEAGALVVPVSEGSSETVEKQILHWDGQRWSSEPIEIPTKSKEDFRVLAIGASSPQNAWILAALSSNYGGGTVALFHRVEEAHEQFSWKPVALKPGPGDEEAHPLSVPVVGPGAPSGGEPFEVPGASTETPVVKAQLLTVTSQGVWIDGARGDVEDLTPASTTLFFEPEGSGGGHVAASWCELPAETPSGTLPCEHELPEALPTGPSRSIAWAGGGSPFGERVITGLPDGVSLRLQGETFTRVLALGGGEEALKDPGAQYGAAFSTPTEGWLGEGAMPVHLTLKPQSSRLTSWPISFRHPLLAVAPEPGAPVGALTSEALAVGTDGAVARFKPGVGWLPESLFGSGEHVETNVQLRAVAWPTPNRAYAVGDEGEMWLWRGETGLWERDPATPINFRANLVGVAFDPRDPALGYAVGTQELGQGGVLLRYGKTWTEEALPPQVQGADLTAIAFAGSEAIVAYDKRISASSNEFAGGLLVNEGSGWHVDQQAEAAAEGGTVRALAALSDGGAAFIVETDGEQRVVEREAAGSPWQVVPTPLPHVPAGSLALFREGGALRAIVTAGGAGLSGSNGSATPGLPPYLVSASGVFSGAESGGVLRQTAVGWSDDSHELNPVGGLEASYIYHDLPYRPDPIDAVLIDPTGTQGWAVGGVLSSTEPLVDTANVERYPADGVTPLGSSAAPVPTFAGTATFAFGGDAQCAAPCADFELARAGPPVWLRSALALAGGIGIGSEGGPVGAFFDLGPTVTEGATVGTPPALPYGRELAGYASILAGARLPVYDAIAPADLDARPASQGSEAAWESAFAGFPRPFGDIGAASSEEPARCGAQVGCESAYYAVEKDGVWVLVLDDSARGEVDQAQREWVEGRLGGAGSEHKPVIVVGDSDLATEIAAHNEEAIRLFEALVGDNPDSSPAGDPEHYVASAYFFQTPEENVQAPLVYGDQQLATFGTGTLGYEQASREQTTSFHGAKGILLGEVHSSERKPDDEAPVSARLIPVIGELALEAKQGILLRRSNPALFEGLARRPRGGCRATSGEQACTEDQYTPIPSVCVGTGCQTAVLPEYEFSSSNREVGRFVERNTAAGEALTVLQNAKGEPIPDEPEPGKPRTGQPQAGLFCPFNAGTTIVTLRVGGLSSSVPVTVQPGSVREPCGTVPIKHQTTAGGAAVPAAPPPAPAPAPSGPAPASSPPPVPVPSPPPAAPVATPAPPVRVIPPPAPFFLPPVPVTPLLAFVPPPVPTPARPTPPTGTSAVTSPIEVAEHEEEEESATESVSNQALAYSAPEHEPSPVYLLGIVLLAAFAGATTVRRRPRRGRRELRVAPATLTGMRSQRRMRSGSSRRR